MGDHPQSLKNLMINSVKYREGKSEKRSCEIEKILKFNVNKQLEL